jgi:hypothetical protein
LINLITPPALLAAFLSVGLWYGVGVKMILTIAPILFVLLVFSFVAYGILQAIQTETVFPVSTTTSETVSVAAVDNEQITEDSKSNCHIRYIPSSSQSNEVITVPVKLAPGEECLGGLPLTFVGQTDTMLVLKTTSYKSPGGSIVLYNYETQELIPTDITVDIPFFIEHDDAGVSIVSFSDHGRHPVTGTPNQITLHSFTDSGHQKTIISELEPTESFCSYGTIMCDYSITEEVSEDENSHTITYTTSVYSKGVDAEVRTISFALDLDTPDEIPVLIE